MQEGDDKERRKQSKVINSIHSTYWMHMPFPKIAS